MSINGLGVTNIEYSKATGNDGVEKNAVAKNESQSGAKVAEDTTDFTSRNATVESLSQSALAVSPTRQQKVEALRQAVSSAQYQLDSDRIAESLVNATD